MWFLRRQITLVFAPGRKCSALEILEKQDSYFGPQHLPEWVTQLCLQWSSPLIVQCIMNIYRITLLFRKRVLIFILPIFYFIFFGIEYGYSAPIFIHTQLLALQTPCPLPVEGCMKLQPITTGQGHAAPLNPLCSRPAVYHGPTFTLTITPAIYSSHFTWPARCEVEGWRGETSSVHAGKKKKKKRHAGAEKEHTRDTHIPGHLLVSQEGGGKTLPCAR